ncbi:MAG: hypothetical protein CBE33_04130 [Candidatus Pelagibacter sp. TMED273]|nr:MAG: hypothetical protein CBE33_04130 [Candidatus Pelagibacter sp. TMED273]
METNMFNRRVFKKALITGISGSGGSYLAEYILENHKKVKVYGIYRKFNKLNLKNIKDKASLFKCNLNQLNSVKIILKKTKPDVIFHLASEADVRKSFDEPYKIIKNNNDITLNLLESVRQIGINPVIQICSTSEIYGNYEKNKSLDEKVEFNPNNPYAVSKLFQDILAKNYFINYGLKIIITRMFTYLNPRRINLFASHWAYQINLIKQNKKKYLEHGNLNSTRTIMDVRDAMRAYWMAATLCDIGGVYNIGSNKKILLSKFLKILIKKSKIKIKTKIDKKLLRKTDIKFQIPNSKKFRNKTNWKPEIEIEKSIDFLISETKKLT